MGQALKIPEMEVGGRRLLFRINFDCIHNDFDESHCGIPIESEDTFQAGKRWTVNNGRSTVDINVKREHYYVDKQKGNNR